MTRTDHAQAPESATGTCRERRRPQRGDGERPQWVRPYRRMQHALDASVRLLQEGIATAKRSGRVLTRRPIDSSRKLERAEARLALASVRLERAARELVATTDCLARQPETAAGAPELLVEATERWAAITQSLGEVTGAVLTFHEDVLQGLRSGVLVPERSNDRRPRIILAPRPTFFRAFLTARQPRVVDRISCVLQRRRRAPRPASVSVPRRALQGRAPPLSL